MWSFRYIVTYTEWQKKRLHALACAAGPRVLLDQSCCTTCQHGCKHSLLTAAIMPLPRQLPHGICMAKSLVQEETSIATCDGSEPTCQSLLLTNSLRAFRMAVKKSPWRFSSCRDTSVISNALRIWRARQLVRRQQA